MKKFILPAIIFISCITASAQTCVGVIGMRLIDPKTKKPFTEKDKLEKNIWYVFTQPEQEWYNTAEAVQPLDSMIKAGAFTVKHNEKGYNFYTYSADNSLTSFAGLCGLYLVQTQFIHKKDTMNLAFYNIPSNQSFQMDTLVFQKGHYLIDFYGARLMSELEFADDKGYFLLPQGVMTPFLFKKKED